MSLAKTLIKVAIGVAVAKGVSTLVKGGAGGPDRSASGRPGGVEDIMDGIGGGSRQAAPQQGQRGGIEDILGQLTGQGSGTRRPRQNAPKGGLEDLLGGGAGAQGGGGLGDLLGQLAGGGGSANRSTQAGGGGGLGDLLGQLTGGGAAQGGQGGGLGDLLGQLTGSGTASRGAAGGGGGLGDLLGQLTGGGAAQGGAGGGLGDLLGAVLGGAGGGALSGQASSRDQDLAAALILRAMVQAVKADGELDREERDKLMKHAEGASQEEIAFINAELENRTTVSQLASQVPEGMEAQVYVMSLMAIDLDNQKEAQYLHSLAEALSLEPRDVNALHDRAGVAHLYR